MFKELERVVLTDYVIGHDHEKLSPGDVGCVVHVHPGAEAYIVEFVSLEGETVAIATVLPSQARAVKRADITHARTMTPSVAA